MTLLTIINSVTTKTDKNCFKNFGLAVLSKAEESLAAGNDEKAFSLFRTAISRAVLYGDRETAKKIRNRMGWYGKENYATQGDTVWKFIEYYAVNSNDFEKTSTSVEEWFLINKNGKYVFNYNLIDESGNYSYWETQFDRYSYFLRRRLLRFMNENQKLVLKNELQLFDQNCNVEKIPLNLVAPNGIRECQLCIDGLKEEDESFLLGSKGYCKIDVEKGKRFLKIEKQRKEYNIKQIIILRANKVHSGKIKIYLVREYGLI